MNLELTNFNHNLTLKQLNTIISDIKKNKIVASIDYTIGKYNKKIWYNTSKYSNKLHALKFIQYTLEYYQKFNDDSGLEKAIALFYLWYEENYPKSKSKECYQGKVLAERLLNVSNLLIICKMNDICILDDIFIEVITSHIGYNLMDINYSSNHFTAICQDISIINASIIYQFYYIDNAFNKAINKACSRLQKQIDYYVRKGQYLGNSLKKCYKLFILLFHLYEFLSKYTELSFTIFLKTKLDELYYFIYNMTFPGGLFDNSLVNLEAQVLVNYPHNLNNNFVDLYIKKNDMKLINKVLVYDMAKIFIYNNSLEFNESYYKLIFTNGFFSQTEKKYDNLHFDLYYKDILLFIKNNKNLTVNSRNYNNIIVDSHDFLIDKSQINLCCFTSYAKVNELAFISGLHLLYEDVLIKRNLVLFKDYIIIIDEFLALENHDFEINFNIHPNILLEVDKENNFYGNKSKNNLFTLRALYSSTDYLSSNKDNIITFKIKSMEGVFITLIDFNRKKHKFNLKVKENRIFINNFMIIRDKYYNEILYKNENITERLASEKECLKELGLLYQNKK